MIGRRTARACVPAQMRHRAEVARAACPELLIDTDDWRVPTSTRGASTSRSSRSSASRRSTTRRRRRDRRALRARDYAALRRDVGELAEPRDERERRRPPARLEPPPRPVTLADVAREAGTSPSTASRALSGRGYVSPAARERLLEVAERLGYVPNASARTLKQQTSRVVGVVVSDLGNQFYARLAAGIEQTLREADYQMLLLGDNSESAEETRRRAHVPRHARRRRDHDAGRQRRGRRCSRRTASPSSRSTAASRRSPCDARRDRQRARRRARRPRTCSSSATGASGCSSPRPTGRATPAGCDGYRARARATPASPLDERLIVPIAVPRARRRAADRGAARRRRADRDLRREQPARRAGLARAAPAAARSCRATSRSSASTTCPGWRWSTPRSPPSRSRRSRWAAARRSCCCGRDSSEPGRGARADARRRGSQPTLDRRAARPAVRRPTDR